MAADRRWIAFASLGVVAVFVVGMSLFPTGLVGAGDWSARGTAVLASKQCGNHNDELSRFVKDAVANDKVLGSQSISGRLF